MKEIIDNLDRFPRSKSLLLRFIEVWAITYVVVNVLFLLFDVVMYFIYGVFEFTFIEKWTLPLVSSLGPAIAITYEQQSVPKEVLASLKEEDILFAEGGLILTNSKMVKIKKGFWPSDLEFNEILFEDVLKITAQRRLKLSSGVLTVATKNGLVEIGTSNVDELKEHLKGTQIAKKLHD